MQWKKTHLNFWVKALYLQIGARITSTIVHMKVDII